MAAEEPIKKSNDICDAEYKPYTKGEEDDTEADKCGRERIQESGRDLKTRLEQAVNYMLLEILYTGGHAASLRT